MARRGMSRYGTSRHGTAWYRQAFHPLAKDCHIKTPTDPIKTLYELPPAGFLQVRLPSSYHPHHALLLCCCRLMANCRSAATTAAILDTIFYHTMLTNLRITYWLDHNVTRRNERNVM